MDYKADLFRLLTFIYDMVSISEEYARDHNLRLSDFIGLFIKDTGLFQPYALMFGYPRATFLKEENFKYDGEKLFYIGDGDDVKILERTGDYTYDQLNDIISKIEVLADLYAVNTEARRHIRDYPTTLLYTRQALKAEGVTLLTVKADKPHYPINNYPYSIKVSTKKGTPTLYVDEVAVMEFVKGINAKDLVEKVSRTIP